MATLTKKPKWLNKRINLSDCSNTKSLLRSLNLHTVCEEAACPNISECFHKGTATFMILGSNCTRSCKFCNIKNGQPSLVDKDEPVHIADAVKKLGLKHVVITSVTRDDLEDGGAEQFARTISNIRSRVESIAIEVLIPDFKGNREAIKKIAEQGPDIINHNLETVPRLYPAIRPEADYKRSLEVLKTAKESAGPKAYTKSGIMLGFGETEKEILQVFADLRGIGCDFLSIGQYLAPSREHYPVKEYITPNKFQYYKREAEEMGFKFVASAPYVRSSYLAEEYI
ncbi:MAG: lipoyl synthase [Candidatus Omnitrophica bacterium]|nr:lipoyl synthase [Candidatus Omnitrophota bacterium]